MDNAPAGPALGVLFWFVMPPHSQASQHIRNAYNWCAVMGWSAESKRKGTPAMDLEHMNFVLKWCKCMWTD